VRFDVALDQRVLGGPRGATLFTGAPQLLDGGSAATLPDLYPRPRWQVPGRLWAAGNENGRTAKTGQLLGTLDMRAEVVRCWAMTRQSSCNGSCMMRTVVNRRAFDFDEVRFDWGDVVLAAIGWGGWQLLECSAADGLAAACAAEECREQVDTGALRDSVVRLRRARGLLAGEDYERWLADWSLSTEDLRLYFAHTTLSGGTAGGVANQSADDRPDTAPLARAVRNAAILSGRLQSWAERLAKCAAAAAGLTALGQATPTVSRDGIAGLVAAAGACRASGLDEADVCARAPRIAELQTAERMFADHVVKPERIKRCIAEHRLDWQRFAWEEVSFPGEGAAREAALLVREGGMGLAEVAGLAHVAIGLREAYSEDATELAGVLAAAVPGELLGPLAGECGWRLVRVRERTPPAGDDIDLRDRARSELLEDAVGRYLAGRVTWHGEH
jgi:hypothetical protein